MIELLPTLITIPYKMALARAFNMVARVALRCNLIPVQAWCCAESVRLCCETVDMIDDIERLANGPRSRPE